MPRYRVTQGSEGNFHEGRVKDSKAMIRPDYFHISRRCLGDYKGDFRRHHKFISNVTRILQARS